jgi:hypothetical protein
MLRNLTIFSILTLGTPAAVAGDDFIREGFVMPSRNINCTVQQEGVEGTTSDGWRLYCVRFQPTPIVVILTKRGVETYDSDGDQPSGQDRWVFTYGDPWESGPFECVSSQTGLTCTHTNGKGFKLSRKGVSTF